MSKEFSVIKQNLPHYSEVCNMDKKTVSLSDKTVSLVAYSSSSSSEIDEHVSPSIGDDTDYGETSADFFNLLPGCSNQKKSEVTANKT